MASQINVNQFAPQAMAGLCINPSHGERIEAEFYDTTANATLTIAVPCKFVAGTTNANISVAACTAATDPATAGVVIYDSSKRNTYVSGQYVTLARKGSIVLLKASAAIAANAYVAISPDGTVATAAAGNAVVGIAMNSVTQDELVRVLFVEPYVMSAAVGG